MKRKNRSVRWLWCWSYIIVMLIPMITVAINYNINVKALRDGIIRTNESVLNHVKENIDDIMIAEKEFYSYAFLDENYQNLRYSIRMDSRFFNVAALFHKNLANYRNGIDDMSCMIYLDKEDYLITDFNTSSTERYYVAQKYSFDNVLDYDTWKERLSDDYKDKYLVVQGLVHCADEKSLVYANTVNSMQNGEHNFFVSVPISIIEKITENLLPGTWLIVEIEEEKAVFYDGRLTDIPEESSKYISRIVPSEISGISYRMLLPEQSLNAGIEDMRRSFWLNLSITLIFGIIGITVLLNLNYKPLRSLLEEIKGEKNDSLGQGNEFQLLEDNYVQLRKEKYDSQILVEKQKQNLRSTWLLMLMKGRTLKYQEKENKEYLGLSLENSIALVGFMIPLEQSNFQYDELRFFIVDNIFSELMEGQTFYHIEDGGFVFYLFDLQPGMEEAWRRETLTKIEFVCKILIEKSGTPVVGVVSDIGESVHVIRQVYQNVVNAFEYGSVIGMGGVIDVREMPGYNEFHIFEDYIDKELREAFAANDINRVNAVCEKLFAGFKGNSVEIVKARMYRAFIIVMDIFKEYVNDVVKQEKAIGYLGLLSREQTIEGIKARFGELLHFSISEISYQELLENRGIIIKIIKYVEANYTDCNLNLSSMAEDLQKNSRYLSRVFKEEKQMSILDYINNFRIMKAKELMQTREYTMEEIAKQVGYGNIRTFRRAFVKVTGELPSEYVETYTR